MAAGKIPGIFRLRLYVQGGFGIILDWALNFETKYGGQYVLDGARAPETEAKKDLIETCRGPAEAKAAEMVEELLAVDQARVRARPRDLWEHRWRTR